MPSVSLSGPDDALLRAVLVKQFADRQLAVDEALIGYLCPGSTVPSPMRAPRWPDLDREALQRGRPVNRALAAELFRRRRDKL